MISEDTHCALALGEILPLYRRSKTHSRTVQVRFTHRVLLTPSILRNNNKRVCVCGACNGLQGDLRGLQGWRREPPDGPRTDLAQ